MIGALGTAMVNEAMFGGRANGGKAMGAQLLVQAETVVTTIVWAAIGAVIAITLAKAVTALWVSTDVQREGLDLGEHGERANNC